MKSSKKKTVKTWTPNGYIFSALRKIMRWSPAYRNCKKAKNCAICAKEFRPDETKLADHIEPVVDPVVGFTTWDVYVQRMFFGKLQALCDSCHKAKTKKEAGIRAEIKRQQKAA